MLRVMASVCLAAAAAGAQVGTVDTIGGTRYDWQLGGPQYRFITGAPGLGVHAVWLYSATSSPWPDRTYRYNYYDFATRTWNWINPDYMASGVAVYTQRNGFGTLENDPTSNVAVVVGHAGTPLRPVIARELACGSGTFEYCDGAPHAEAYQWPVLAVDGEGVMHVCCIDNATQDQVWYTKCDPWCAWSVPVGMAGSVPDPCFPCHTIAASKVSQKVALCWTNSEGSPYNESYLRTSSDAGLTWSDPAELPPPPAYGPETLTTYHITSLFPYYDRHDRLHFVVNVCPIVRDTTWILPTEIWHWCEENVPQWNEVHRAGCEPQNLWASPGYNTTYAGRPSIGEDTAGNLFVAWEQFDSANVEPSTNLLRADIFLSYSRDNGLSWAPALQLTEAVTESNRFPCVIDYVTDGMVRVWYMADLQAGFIVQGQGILTDNPIVVRSIPVDSLRGLAENRESVPNGAPQAASICRGVLFLPGGAGHLPRDMTEFGTANSGRVPRPELVDVSGRTVMPLKPGPNDVRHLPASVYFVHSSLDTRHSSLSTKVVIQR